MAQKLSVLIVEDEKEDSDSIIRELNERYGDFKLSGVTGDSDQAIIIALKEQPDVVILDLELHFGNGYGLDFLSEIAKKDIKKPYVLITTNNVSLVIHKLARSLGADYIMTKTNADYSAQKVIEHLLMGPPR